MTASHNSAAATLQQILAETPNHSKIKETLKLLTITREKINYHAIVSGTDTYLQLRGLANHDPEEFNYINKMLHSRIVGVIGRIKRQELDVRDFAEEQRLHEEEQFKM